MDKKSAQIRQKRLCLQTPQQQQQEQKQNKTPNIKKRKNYNNFLENNNKRNHKFSQSKPNTTTKQRLNQWS